MITIPDNLSLPPDFSSLTSIEKYHAIVFGTFIMVSIKKNPLNKDSDIEQYKNELKKMAEKDITTIRNTIYESSQKERDFLEKKWANDFEREIKNRDNLIIQLQNKLEYAEEYKTKTALLEQEILSLKRNTDFAVQCAVTQNDLLHKQKYMEMERKATEDSSQKMTDYRLRIAELENHIANLQSETSLLLEKKINETEKNYLYQMNEMKEQFHNNELIIKELQQQLNHNIQLQQLNTDTTISDLQQQIVYLKEIQQNQRDTTIIELQSELAYLKELQQFNTDKTISELQQQLNSLMQLQQSDLENCKLNCLQEYNTREQEWIQLCDSLKKQIDAIQQETTSQENEALKIENNENQKIIQDLLHKIQVIEQNVVANKSGDRGKVGEDYFSSLIDEAFNGYINHFECKNTSKIPHSGDFLLYTLCPNHSFTVMVDVKNYIDSSSVGSKELRKLKYDLSKNTNIKIGWLLCLNKPFANKNSSLPFYFEFEDDICIFIINSLQFHENPIQLLRSIWKCSEIIHDRLISLKTDSEQIQQIKENEKRMVEILNDQVRISKEQQAIMKRLKDSFDEINMNTQKMLSMLLKQGNIEDEILYDLKEWWHQHIFVTNDSNDSIKIYNLFCQFTKSYSKYKNHFETFKNFIVQYNLIDIQYITYTNNKTTYTIHSISVV